MKRAPAFFALLAVLAFGATLGAQSDSAPAPPPPAEVTSPSEPPAASASAEPPAPAKPSSSLSFGVVELKNGDRVSGEIKSYEEGRLFVRAPEGDFNVKWNNIVSIRSSTQFEIETSAGVHHFGSLAPSDPPGQLIIVTKDALVILDFFDVVRITPIYQTFLRRFDGSLDLGANYTHASDLLQFNVEADARFKKPKSVMLADFSVFYSRQHGETTSQRGHMTLTYFDLRPNRWVYGGLVGFENNRDLGLQLRSTAGLFVGRFLVLKNQSNLVVPAGLMGNHETGTTGEDTNNVEGAVDARYSTFTYDFPKLWFDAYLKVVPGITDSPRVRIDATAKIKREVILKDFFLSLSIFYNYDSHPPSTLAVKSDWGPIIAIGWVF